MTAPFLASLNCYPVKSLGGFAMREAPLTDRGLKHDRRWMLVDATGRFLTQRELPSMACLHTAPAADGFEVNDLRDGERLMLPWTLDEGPDPWVQIWDARVRAREAPSSWSVWFSDRLGSAVRLVHMPDDAQRRVDERYAQGLTSLSDGFPYMILSEASVDALNDRGTAWAQEHTGTWALVPMERFRPNLVIGGGAAHQEDGWREVRIGAVRFILVKPCARCIIITTDQRTGERGKEPLRTLASYRTVDSKVHFGMNAVADVDGIVRVGDPVQVVADGR